MDRDALSARVRRRLGEDTADFFTDAEIISELDQAIIAFAHEEEWPWLQTAATIAVTASTSTYALPNDVDVNRVVVAQLTVSSTIYPLNRVTASDGFRLMGTYTGTATPRWYMLYTEAQSTVTRAATLKFLPTPNADATFSYLYYRRPGLLSGGTIEPDIPEDFHEALVAYATAKMWTHELVGSELKAGEQMSMYQEIVAKARRQSFRLGDDEQLAWGKMDDERERAGMGPFRLPNDYGWPDSGTWE